MLARCIASLRQQTNLEIKILLSTNSTHFLANVKPLRYIDKIFVCKPTDGFSTLNNVAIDFGEQAYKPDYFLLINDDAFIRSDFFFMLENFFRSNAIDIIVPCIYDIENKVIDSYGVEYFKSGYAKNSTVFSQKTTLATAGCVIFSAKILKKVKEKYGTYFNSLLHFYLEDVELSIRMAMIKAKFYKEDSLKVYHQVSASSGRKSKFTMYQTYRNILWVIILTWPVKNILRHLASILLVQAWAFFWSTYRFGPVMYMEIVFDTMRNFTRLKNMRKKYLAAYEKSIDFEDILSPLTFRTYHGIKVRVS